MKAITKMLLALSMLIAGALLISLFVVPATVKAGDYECPGGCSTSVYSGKCFHCLVNPAPAYCSCALGPPASCPASTILCGNCGSECGVDACSDKCPGCLPFSCPPVVPPGGNAASSPSKVAPPTPSEKALTIAAWVRSQSLMDGVSSHSHLMREMLLSLRNMPPASLDCAHLTALLIDPEDPQPMQMKAFIQTSDKDVTLITIINRATEQDETLFVHPSKSMWFTTPDRRMRRRNHLLLRA